MIIKFPIVLLLFFISEKDDESWKLAGPSVHVAAGWRTMWIQDFKARLISPSPFCRQRL
jgi:hypothetical protein